MEREFSMEILDSTYSNCRFCLSKYANNNRLFVGIVTYMDGYLEDVLDVTVNVDDDLPSGCIALKNYSENEGLLDQMVSIGLITDIVGYTHVGFVEVPVCRYSDAVLEQYADNAA